MLNARSAQVAVSRMIAAVAVAVGLFAVPDLSQVQAQALSRTRYTNGASLRRAFLDVVTDANDWTVRVKSGDDVVAFGIIVREDGYILSKASQLQGELTVRLVDGRELPADYIGYNSEHDVALLRVDAVDLKVVNWQESDDPRVGGWVITPDQQGAPNSIGVVSLERRAIPRVKQQAILGINMKPDHSPVVVEGVIDDSAAERAGLLANDVIHQVDDVTITTPASMKFEISRRSPGDTISLKVQRNDEEITLRATLTHPFGAFQSRIAMQNHMGGDLSARRTGFPVVLQHDTVLEPNECGGPLVDLSGRAIGMNIARAGRTESYAIPDDILRPLVNDLLSGNYPPPGDQQPTVAADLAEDVTVPDESDSAHR